MYLGSFIIPPILTDQLSSVWALETAERSRTDHFANSTSRSPTLQKKIDFSNKFLRERSKGERRHSCMKTFQQTKMRILSLRVKTQFPADPAVHSNFPPSPVKTKALREERLCLPVHCGASSGNGIDNRKITAAP